MRGSETSVCHWGRGRRPVRGSLPLKRNGQAFHSQDPADSFQWNLTDPLDLSKSLKHDFQGNPGLQARQGSPDTEVDTMPKGQMAVGRSAYVKDIGLRKLRLVTVGRTEASNHELSRLDLLVTYDRINRSSADEPLDGGEVAQDLLNRPWHQGRVGAQLIHDLRMVIKTENRVADQISRGDIARN